MSPVDRDLALKRYICDRSWGWVFAFALNIAERDGNALVVWQLASGMICYVGVFTFLAILDEVNLEIPRAVERLCRWLVHYDMTGEQAWNDVWLRPNLEGEGASGLLETLFQREYRNSRTLFASWELLENSTHPRAAPIRDGFLGEFRSLVEREADLYRSGKLDNCASRPYFNSCWMTSWSGWAYSPTKSWPPYRLNSATTPGVRLARPMTGHQNRF